MKKFLELLASLCIILIIIVIFILIWDLEYWVLYLRIIGTAGFALMITVIYAKLKKWL